jgi:hypothetical protein
MPASLFGFRRHDVTRDEQEIRVALYDISAHDQGPRADAQHELFVADPRLAGRFDPHDTTCVTNWQTLYSTLTTLRAQPSFGLACTVHSLRSDHGSVS